MAAAWSRAMAERRDEPGREPPSRPEGRSSALASTQPAPPEGFPEENPNRPREYHGRRTMLVALGVAGAVALAVWLAVSSGGSPSIPGDLGVATLPDYLNPDALPVAAEVDALAPDFELETLDGQRFRLSDLRGHPVVLNFWASWCGPCRQEMPVLVRLAAEYRELGVLIVGVNIEEARGPARGFIDEFGVPFAIPMDFGGGVTRAYFRDELGPPRTFFLRPDGTIARVFIGQGPDEEFASATAALASAIGEPLGPDALPGPKAVPSDRLPDDREVGAAVGQVAPDFLLTDGSGRSWRFSEANRLGPVLLALVPPDCGACDAVAVEAAASARAAGIEVALVGGAGGEGATVLSWRADVAALFGGAESLALVLVDQDGVVAARGDTTAAIEAGVARIGVRAAAADDPRS